jgi:hypothetical protein
VDILIIPEDGSSIFFLNVGTHLQDYTVSQYRRPRSQQPVCELQTYILNVRFEVVTAVTMKNAVFWDVAPCSSCVNRRFGGTYRIVCSLQPPAYAGSSLADFFTLKMEAICSSETSVHTITTIRHIPENGILLTP